VASLLDAVAEGRLSSAEALACTEQWTDVPWNEKVFADAYHALQHFEADADIRAKDAEYAKSQIAGLRSFSAKLLKIG